jgi:hypothetical protein
MEALSTEQVEQHAAEIEEKGFSVMENAIPEDFLPEIMAELERLQQVRPGGDIPPAPFTGFVTRRWFDVLNDGDVWQRVATHPWILPVLNKVLGDGFLLSTMGTAVVGDGEEAQTIHGDDMLYAMPRPHPNLVCNTMWALSDFTEETGATRVVPGSNNLPDDPDLMSSYDTVPLEMPRGSIAFVVGTCYHGAGKNTSGKDRHALTINYCRGSMRQQENLMLGVHPSRLMTFPKELQDILGFKLFGGAGHIFAQDPRVEMERHYGDSGQDDPYLERRDGLHTERTGIETG